jgi:hypothetical protein
VRLARQLARTEDKLERVLQELEELRDQVAADTPGGRNGRAARSSGTQTTRRTRRTTAAARRSDGQAKGS